MTSTTTGSDTCFDVVVLGTGLTESISAAALSKTGLSVLQVDTNSYYGSSEACLTTTEMQAWLKRSHSSPSLEYRHCSGQDFGTSPARSYALSSAPSIIPATGPLISSLIESGVSRYGEFKLMQKISVFLDGKFRSVPGSKEDIFKSKDLSLVDKRKLMRFLTFTMGDFENAIELEGKASMPFGQFLKEVFLLSDSLVKTIAFALALNTQVSDQTSDSLNRLQRFLTSSGRYGPSPFLVGLYGGLGELSQGFCRSCAVSGGTYMLNQTIDSIDWRPSEEKTKGLFRLTLGDSPDPLTSRTVISSAEYAQYLKNGNAVLTEVDDAQEVTVHGVIVAKTSISLHSFSDPDSQRLPEERDKLLEAGMLVFPPGELPAGKALGAVSVLINGEGVLSCPRGEGDIFPANVLRKLKECSAVVLYLTTRLPVEEAIDEEGCTAELLLSPYVETTLRSIIPFQESAAGPTLPAVVFKAFYLRKASYDVSNDAPSNFIVCPPLTSHVALAGDDAAFKAEAVFRTTLRQLDVDQSDCSSPFWPPLDNDGEDDDG